MSEPRDYGERLDKKLSMGPGYVPPANIGVEFNGFTYDNELWDLGRTLEVRLIVAVFHE